VISFSCTHTGHDPDSVPGRGFTGRVEEATLGDLVQMICLEGLDRTLRVSTDQTEGTIFFSGGKVVHASVNSLEGEDAFYEIMSWPRGLFELKKEVSRCRTVETPWNFLLMEASRRLDEAGLKNEESAEKVLKILIVDDSRLICKALKNCFGDMAGVEVAGEASNGQEALSMITEYRPDMVTLDVNMPVMGGDVALKHIMIRSPAPVILISGLGDGSVPKIMEFLRLGAVDFIPKPSRGQGWSRVVGRLACDVGQIRGVKVGQIRRARMPKRVPPTGYKPENPSSGLIIFLGGIGGMLELQKILPAMDRQESTSVLVVQDMDRELVAPFADFLDGHCQYSVGVLKEMDRVLGGRCLVTDWRSCWEAVQGDRGIKLVGVGSSDSRQRITGLLSTAAEFFGSRLMVIVLSGTDSEAREGLEEAASRGARIFFQKPETCLNPRPLIELLASEVKEDKFESEALSGMLSDIQEQKNFTGTSHGGDNWPGS